jgi:hypothetical protein
MLDDRGLTHCEMDDVSKKACLQRATGLVVGRGAVVVVVVVVVVVRA